MMIYHFKKKIQMKLIKFATPNGEYTVELRYIAEDRAKEYAKENTEEYDDEVEFVMEDDFEGIDWLINNMDYEDIEDITTKVSDIVKVTYEDFWTSSEHFEIIDNEKND